MNKSVFEKEERVEYYELEGQCEQSHEDVCKTGSYWLERSLCRTATGNRIKKELWSQIIKNFAFWAKVIAFYLVGKWDFDHLGRAADIIKVIVQKYNLTTVCRVDWQRME